VLAIGVAAVGSMLSSAGSYPALAQTRQWSAPRAWAGRRGTTGRDGRACDCPKPWGSIRGLDKV